MKFYLKTKDHSVTQEEFTLNYNKDLDMLVTDPQPENLGVYYESDDYISHTDSKKTVVDKMYQTVKNYSLQKKIQILAKFTKGEKTLLDVGAGTGDFLITAKNNKWICDGVEPSASAREKATQKGLELFSSLETLPDKKYNVITLWHVLEHLPNLDEQIKTLESKLTEDGTLIIAVPNFNSYDAKHYKEFWAAYDVPRHLWHFSKTAIKKIFAKHNMKLIQTKPMLFDAFYVSLLSEKYKTGNQNMLTAFYRGLRSNISAMKTKEHSSIIYILKKS